MEESPEGVCLVIKAANQSYGDQKIPYHTDWTVLDLKTEISKIHPGKPPIQGQRLIYSGQLLQDKLTLKEVLRHPPENNAHTIHMVSAVARAAPPTRKTEPIVQSTSASSAHSSETITDSNTSSDGVRRRVMTSESPVIQAPQGLDSPTLYPHFSQLPPPIQAISDPLQQMAAMQHMYAQYMASYMQYMQTPPPQMLAGSSSYQVQQMPQASPATSVVDTTDHQLQQQVLPNNNNVAAEVAAQAGNVPNRLVAQGGGGAVVAEEEEEGMPRDWLDYIYYASRLGVLLSLVYFYSTLSRFMLILTCFLAYYVYQMGWLSAILGGQQQQQQHGPNPAPVPVNQPNQQNPQRGDNDNPLQGVEQPPTTNPPQASTPSLQDEAEEDRDMERGDAAAAGAAAPPPEPNDHSEPTTSTPDANSDVINDITDASDVSDASDVTDANVVEDQRPSLMTLSWTFLTAFFTSLVPENPNRVMA